MVAKSSTGFGWDKGAIVTSARWQVTLCDPILHVSSRSNVAVLHCELLYAYTLLNSLAVVGCCLITSMLHLFVYNLCKFARFVCFLCAFVCFLLSGGVLVWLSVLSEVQTCIWPS